VGSAVLGRVLRAALGLDWVTGRASYQTDPVSRGTKWFNLRIVNCPSWHAASGIGCLSLFKSSHFKSSHFKTLSFGKRTNSLAQERSADVYSGWKDSFSIKTKFLR
jgi:hypothetical protein